MEVMEMPNICRDHELIYFGGKALHLQLLQRGGFHTPESFTADNLLLLPNYLRYIVRSSAAGEDGLLKTAAGKYLTIKNVRKEDLEAAVAEVKAHYSQGSVLIQPDLTSAMTFSGVAYSNLNGSYTIAIGKRNSVQRIVEGELPDTEISIFNEKTHLRGEPISPRTIRKVHEEIKRTEAYFGIPLDIEFAVIDETVVFLQARPLPNPTEPTLREHELRKMRRLMEIGKQEKLEEVVLGVGNYREILGNTKATRLSTSTFNYFFSGDGKKILGAVQLGRNEMGYDIGNEISPWVIMVGEKVYYNFVGDALQFRPQGISEEDLAHVVNEVYLPIVRGNPDLLNYPELRIYVQFPEQAERVGLDPEPYKVLAARNRNAVQRVIMTENPPIKVKARELVSIKECLGEITTIVDNIRIGSAKEYVKAARLAFFALEDVRFYLEKMREENPAIFEQIALFFSQQSAEKLRDVIIYDESIGSFEVPEQEEYRYLGSFELSLPRGYPPKRNFKQGRPIPDVELSELVRSTRIVLEKREKVKFTLFRDLDYVKQLYEQLGDLSGFDRDIFFLEYDELSLLSSEPRLARYRVELRKQMKGRNLFPDPIFESEILSAKRVYERKPQLIFGSLNEGETTVKIGDNGYIVDSVDQTVEISPDAKVVFVPDNVRPGSHLFTVLSDYGIPVIAIPQDDLEKFRELEIEISLMNGDLSLKLKE